MHVGRLKLGTRLKSTPNAVIPCVRVGLHGRWRETAKGKYER